MQRRRERARSSPRAQSGAMARTDYSTRGNKDALSIQGTAESAELKNALEVGGQPLQRGGIIYTATFTFHEGRQPRVKVKSRGRYLPHGRRPFTFNREAVGLPKRPKAV